MTHESGHRTGLAANVISGLATSLFNVPSGLAYAQLANVNPVYGLYASISATLVAALSTGTILMISTITSAIALATGSVLDAENKAWDAAQAWLKAHAAN